jgi:dTDP-4-dehydrorhamnose reductase
MASPLLARVLLIGASGQVGSELRPLLESAGTLAAPPRAELDVEDAAAVRSAINAFAVDGLAAACSEAGCAFATFSTDYVFDGLAGEPYRETDPTNPLSAYGASKLAGEQLLRRHGERHFIFRTSGVYGRAGSSVKGYTFIDRVLTQAAEGKPLRIVDDVTFSPSYAKDVASAVVRIVERGVFGTYHVTNAGHTTWFDFAEEGFRIAGLRPEVEAVRASAFTSAVRRPAFSALSNAAMESLGIEPLPEWRDGLARYIAERRERDAVLAGNENA